MFLLILERVRFSLLYYIILYIYVKNYNTQ